MFERVLTSTVGAVVAAVVLLPLFVAADLWRRLRGRPFDPYATSHKGSDAD